jgi:hypothetical protein
MRHDDATPSALPGVGAPGDRTLQRIGWALLLAFVLAGAAGAFGNGALSRVSVRHPGLTIEYERMLRLLVVSEIRVRFEAPAGAAARIAVEPTRAPELEVRSVMPEPVSERATALGSVYELAAVPGRALEVVLRCVPRRPGRSAISIHVEGREPVVLRQWVLP